METPGRPSGRRKTDRTTHRWGEMFPLKMQRPLINSSRILGDHCGGRPWPEALSALFTFSEEAMKAAKPVPSEAGGRLPVR